MQIIDRLVKDLKPYENNPRKNEASVDYVANSIKEFGFRQPIVIDGNNVIVCGHTRLLAAMKLKLKTVPCVLADDLTDERRQAYRLADNKTAESSEWDFSLLDKELAEIVDLDMSDFGFDISINEEMEGQQDSSDEEGYFGDEREKTYNSYNLHDYDESRTDGFYQIPAIRKVDYIPSDLIGFNYMLTSKEYEKGIHFYVDDYEFERCWNQPQLYIDKIKQFDCALTPDFSLYMNMPMAMKIWNVYRSRLIGQLMQDAGITVIPTLSWAEKDTFSFCFDGLEQGGTVSVSTIGVKQDEAATEIWIAGMDAAMEKLKPKTVLVYGGDIGYDFGNAKAVYYSNSVTERMKNTRKKG